MKTCITVKTYISRTSETIVKVDENIEFVILPEVCADNNCLYNLQIKKIKGDFEIQKVEFEDGECVINKETNSFQQKSLFIAVYHTFYILTDEKFEEVVSAIYELKIDKHKIQYLNKFEYFRGKIVLADNGNKEFEYLVKRNSEDFVEITVANPNGVRINGQTQDYIYLDPVDKNINHTLSFIYQLKKPENPKKISISEKSPADLTSSISNQYIKASQQFIGKWYWESSENVDQYLKASGVGLIYRTVVRTLKPQIVIYVFGNHWRMEFNTIFSNFVNEFEIEKEFEQITADGRKVLSKFTLDEYGNLSQIQKATKPGEMDSIFVRYIEKGKLNIEMECNGVRAKCVYCRDM